MSEKNRGLPREKFEPVAVQPIELDALGTELTICFQDLGTPREIRTCYGDICKIVNVLREYARILRMVCKEWDLRGYHRAAYELHADKLEEISKKYQTGIGYDYDKAVEKCRKNRARTQRDSDVGGEAMAMAYLMAQRTAQSGEEIIEKDFITPEQLAERALAAERQQAAASRKRRRQESS